MASEKELKSEKVRVSPEVAWEDARRGVRLLQTMLETEIRFLEANIEIRNAYSPVTWIKLCRYIHHATEGMTAVRLAASGMSTSEIHTATGIRSPRIAAFRAWNTRWRKAIAQFIHLKWEKEEERRADIAFLKFIGISLEEVR